MIVSSVISVVVFAAVSAAGVDQLPVPDREESFASYVDRWEMWHDGLPADETLYPEILAVHRKFRLAIGRDMPYLVAVPNSDAEEFEFAKGFVREHRELVAPLRELPVRPHLGASVHGYNSELHQRHYAKLGAERDDERDPMRLPLDIGLPQIADVGKLIPLLIVDAHIAVEDGEPEIAVRSIEAAMRLVAHLDEPATFLAWISQQRHAYAVSVAIEALLAGHQLEDAQLERLANATDIEYVSLHDALSFEMWGKLQTIEWFFQDAPADGNLTTAGLQRWYEVDAMMRWNTNPLAFTAEAFGTASIHDHRDAVGQIHAAGTKDLLLPRHRIAESKLEAVASEITTQQRFGPLRTVISTAHPVEMYRRYTGLETRVRSTALAVAVYQHHLRHGRFPTSLDEIDADLLGTAPIDLYTGNPLLYRETENGPLIYSAGPDRNNDKGERETADPAWVPLKELTENTAADPDALDGDIILFGKP